MTDDVEIKVDTKAGKASAKLTSPGASTAAKVTAYGTVLLGAFGVIAVVIGLALGYDEIVFGPLHFQKSAGQKTQPVEGERDKNKSAQPQPTEPKKEVRTAEPAKPTEDKAKMNALARMRDTTIPHENNKVGPPLDLKPQIAKNGVVWVLVPIEGDDDDRQSDLPEGAFEENGRLYVKVPLECVAVRGLPMPNEACAASQKSPGGRPVQKQIQ